jgi:hypothetical protein
MPGDPRDGIRERLAAAAPPRESFCIRCDRKHEVGRCPAAAPEAEGDAPGDLFGGAA